jgi:hypothetical protein
MAEFEPLFQGLRSGFVGKERTSISSYIDWKEGVLGGFSKRNAQILP